MFKKMLYLSDGEAKKLRGSVFASTIGQLSLSLPAFVLIAAFLEILQPFFGGEVQWWRLWVLAGVAVFVALLIYLAQRYEYAKTYVVAYETSAQRRTGVAEHLRHLPLSFFQKKNLTEITVNTMTDCATMEQGFSSIFPQMLGTLITVVITCVLLAFYEWHMALAVFISVPLAFGLLLLFRALHEKVGTEQLQSKLEASEQMQEYLEGMKVIKAFGLNGEKFTSLEESYRRVQKASFRHESISGALSTVSMVILRLGLPLTIFVGFTLLGEGRLEMITFLVFLLFSNRIYASLTGPLGMWPDFIYGILSIRRLQSIYNERPMEGSEDVEIEDYSIAFEQVRFAYGSDEVIHEVSFVAHQGKVTALVGPSGSGKSTIAKLAVRFWDVDAGKVLIGGRDVKEIDPEKLLSWIAFVFQDVILFNDTLYNNIAIGKADATREEVEQAAKLANCHEFISAYPDGYHTLTGENGCTLSGGERQRISIARAFLKDAPIVVLDEATASLDPENEYEIQQALSRLIKGKTVLVIAHRLRTIEEADHIVVLDEGSISEKGDHQSLIAQQGLYEHLYSIQNQTFGWSIQTNEKGQLS